ncbi:MAG: glycosyl hydrolase [Acidobacteriia bacterium]|nr:glycosyl hydrolase [Terriglobia bacterium]
MKRISLSLGLMPAALLCFSVLSVAQPVIDSWVSSEDNLFQLSRQLPYKFAAGQGSSLPDIRVDAARRYQTMLGMGSSLEATTAANISRLEPRRQDEVIERLVHPVNGIGMNLMRICIGTSDFTGDPWYSYDDVPAGETDAPLARFSIEKDRAYILPVIKKALQKNPDLLFFASPWSPPGWMKSSGSMIGGHLLPQYYGPYARYLVRFVQAYEAEGVPIYAITVQNEPGVDREKQPKMAYPSSRYTGEAERDFLKFLGPEFRKAGLKTKIWSYDHNFNEKSSPGDEGIDYPTKVLSDPEAARHVSGVAFHFYVGQPSGMSIFHNRFPEMPIHFSEGSVYGARGALRLMDILRNWASSYNAWVTMIDEKRGPNRGPFPPSPTILLRNSQEQSVTYRFDYYIYGQFMKFVQRGAVRIDSGEMEKTFGSVAFRNPDGKIVLIVANSGEEPREFRIGWGELTATASLPKRSVATYAWQP